MADPRALLQKAEKAASGAGGGFSFFGGRAEKWEDAAGLYTQAANAFRLQKQGKEAGQAFERAASIQKSQLNEPDDAANSLIEAFKAYKKIEPMEACRVATQAINHYTSKGNLRRAAQYQQNLAEVYEEIGDMRHALEAYETAAGWFESDGAEALANKDCDLKVGDLAALEGDYQRGIASYERVAKASVNNNLMRWSVKDYFMKAGICHLASGDLVAVTRALDQYRELDPSFASTREFKLLADLKETVEAGEQEQFSDILFQFDQMSPLDKWKTTMLLRVKNAIEETGEDFS